ncbi:PepSY domain-containing protein [Rummeliibacillus sp. TYF005]|uniref:PepSY domain-containing protein n=1 Tax=Rummeliibacillus sp. TYF005 TaxID=2058214 RepID=UPI0013DDCF8C|nr:PepSY domain-containing protein [Rummeliibacillus sp. TYF005]
MRKVKHLSLLTIIILAIAAIFSVCLMWNHESTENRKSTEEVYKSIETMYGGEIVSFKNNGDEYAMELSKNGANYHIEVRAKDGKVLQMKRTDLDGLKKEDILSKQEVNRVIKNHYNGRIESELLNTWQNEMVYQIQVTAQSKKLNIIVDAITGEILSETRVNLNAKNTAISKKEAQQIAIKKLNGTIQNTTYYETSSGGYYLVKIEKKGINKTFQIHGVSGKVMSITND